MPRKPVLSPTRIQAYLVCAMKYRYIYVDRIGRFYQRARPEFSLGTTLHQVLQTYHQEGEVQSAEEMVEGYRRVWIAAGYESAAQEQEFHAAGVEMVASYRAAAEERRVEEVETLFTEKQVRTDMGSFVLAGRIDRIDRHADGTLEIVDYKSGRREVTSAEVEADLAMSIYQLIVRRQFPGTRVLGTIYCLRTGERASYEMTAGRDEVFATEIRALGDEIIDRDYESIEPRRIDACTWCDFLPRCESFWRRHE